MVDAGSGVAPTPPGGRPPSNFSFLKADHLALAVEAAEKNVIADPRAACFYARRTLELAIVWLYEVDASLRRPYRDDLSSMLFEPTFQTAVDARIRTKMDVIRKQGNAAVHRRAPIKPEAAAGVVRELFHVMFWLARTYARASAEAPHPNLTFDPAAIPRPPSVQQRQASIEALRTREAEHAARDAQLREARADNDALQAELARLREDVAAAKAASAARPDDHDYDEAQTRDRYIDLLLHEAGWPLDDARDRELEVHGMLTANGAGWVDYVLWGQDGRPLALVEAKRTRRDATDGRQQAKLYADCLQEQYGRRPVIYYSNGYETWLWDDTAHPPRIVQGFRTHDELQLLVQRRTAARPLAEVIIDASIVERPYQQRAIRRITESFEDDNRRKALVVMATGAGKTRTVIALTKLLMEAGWVKRALFLADSGFFDLVVIDEAHRSVYQKYRAIFAHFDALLVGLTATPKDDVDRNTYGLFDLEPGVPTDAYTLGEAVGEGYLVPPRAVRVPLTFPARGVRYDDLSADEQAEWEEQDWGDEQAMPDAVAAEAVNRWLFNADTVDKALATLMQRGHRVAGGDRLGKTIIFAKNTDHAEFIAARFDANYPEHAGVFARVITHRTEYAQSLIDAFSGKDAAPHIAVSVDMLDTGIDVPEVVNLVFFKTVRSRTKFWQMIGRGTRLCPDLFAPGEDKEDFLVFDVCDNVAYFNQDIPERGGGAGAGESLHKRLFGERLELIVALSGATGDGDGTVSDGGLRQDLADTLRGQVAGMHPDNFLVRPHRRWAQRYREPGPWAALSADDAVELHEHLADLPTTVRDDDEEAKRFDLIVLRLQLCRLRSEPGQERLRRQVQAIAAGLLEQTAIPAIAEQQALLADLAEDEWWVDVTLPMLEGARRRVRGLVRLLERRRRTVLYTDFEDELGDVGDVDLKGVGTTAGFVRFREKARRYLREHENHVALQKLRRNRPLTRTDLDALQEMLAGAGVGEAADLERAAAESAGLGVFVRSLVGLERAAATDALAGFIEGRTLTAAQLDFVNLVVEHLTANGTMDPGLLYESPFTRLASGGPESQFAEADVERLFGLIDSVRANAIPRDDVA